MTYDEQIIECFAAVCERSNGDGASPSEVTVEMRERGWLTALDTVIDIEREMQRLRNTEGRL